MGPRPRKEIFTPRYWLEATRAPALAPLPPTFAFFLLDAAETPEATDEDEEADDDDNCDDEDEEEAAFIDSAAAALAVDVDPLVLRLGNGLEKKPLGLFGVSLTALTGDAAAVSATLACFGGRPAFF